eukprot:300535-Rhodomonas_salina.1
MTRCGSLRGSRKDNDKGRTAKAGLKKGVGRVLGDGALIAGGLDLGDLCKLRVAHRLQHSHASAPTSFKIPREPTRQPLYP